MVKHKDTSVEQRILDAAKHVFITQGMAGARMQDIADAAGINKAMLHYYFRNKEKLFETIFAEAFENLFPKLQSILESDQSIFKKVELICIEYINQMQAMPYLPIFVLSEVNRQPDEFLKKMFGKRRPPIKAFADTIEMAIQQKEIKPIHPLQLLLNIISLSIFPFMAKPLLQHVSGISKKQYDAMMEERKKMVPQIIIQSIKK